MFIYGFEYFVLNISQITKPQYTNVMEDENFKFEVIQKSVKFVKIFSLENI